MTNSLHKTNYISGSYRKVCDEKPFSISPDGRITMHGQTFLTKTRNDKEVPMSVNEAVNTARALNAAYAAGYEKASVLSN